MATSSACGVAHRWPSRARHPSRERKNGFEADRASWATIERRFGVSARQARRIVKDVGSATLMTDAPIDALEIVTSAIMHHETLIEDLADITDETDDPRVTIAAVRGQIRASESQITLLQNAGLLPTPLSCVGQQIDARRAASRAVEVLDRHGISAEARAELIAALTAL